MQAIRAKGILFRIVAVLAGLAVGALLAETCLRVLRIRPERYPPQQWLAWDGVAFRDTSIWGGGLVKRRSPYADEGVTMGEYIPHAIFRAVFASNPRGYFDHDNSVLATINSLGLRGEEVTADKPAGTYRILGIGDSFAFGEGVKDDDTFLHRLQLRLNASNAEPTRYQVLNAGVQGYNTRDEVVYLEHRWLAVNPDLVLIVFYINDAYDDSAILNRGQELGIYRTTPAGLARYSYLWDLAQCKYHAYQDSRKVEAYYNQQFFSQAHSFLENPGDVKVDWTVCRAALSARRRLPASGTSSWASSCSPRCSNSRADTPSGRSIVWCGRPAAGWAYRSSTCWTRSAGTSPGPSGSTLPTTIPTKSPMPMAAEAIERFVREEFLAPQSGPRIQEPGAGSPSAPAPEHSVAQARPSPATPATHYLSPPDLPQSRKELVRDLLQEGRVDEAEAQLEKALQIEPNDAEAHSNLGNVLHKKKRLAEAIAQYQRALELQPTFAVAHHNLANVLLEQGRVDEAVAHYQRALELQPDFLAARNNLGQVLLQLGRADEAQAQLTRALALRPDFAPGAKKPGQRPLAEGAGDRGAGAFPEGAAASTGLAADVRAPGVGTGDHSGRSGQERRQGPRVGPEGRGAFRRRQPAGG